MCEGLRFEWNWKISEQYILKSWQYLWLFQAQLMSQVRSGQRKGPRIAEGHQHILKPRKGDWGIVEKIITVDWILSLCNEANKISEHHCSAVHLLLDTRHKSCQIYTRKLLQFWATPASNTGTRWRFKSRLSPASLKWEISRIILYIVIFTW